MSSKTRFLIFIALLVGLLAAVNPGLDEFYAYIQKKIAATGNSVDKPMNDFIGGVSKDALKEAVEQGAVRKDYVVCSIFLIKNTRENKIHKILGFGKKIFIPLNESPQWEEVGKEF